MLIHSPGSILPHAPPLETAGGGRVTAYTLMLIRKSSECFSSSPSHPQEAGVFAVVKDVFLPWYNAYRFLVQNVVRLEAEGTKFEPAKVQLGFLHFCTSCSCTIKILFFGSFVFEAHCFLKRAACMLLVFGRHGTACSHHFCSLFHLHR